MTQISSQLTSPLCPSSSSSCSSPLNTSELSSIRCVRRKLFLADQSSIDGHLATKTSMTPNSRTSPPPTQAPSGSTRISPPQSISRTASLPPSPYPSPSIRTEASMLKSKTTAGSDRAIGDPSAISAVRHQNTFSQTNEVLNISQPSPQPTETASNKSGVKGADGSSSSSPKDRTTIAPKNHSVLKGSATPAPASVTEPTLEEIRRLLPDSKCSQRCRKSCFRKAKLEARARRANQTGSLGGGPSERSPPVPNRIPKPNADKEENPSTTNLTTRKLPTPVSSTELNPKTIRKASGKPCALSYGPSSSLADQKRSYPPSPALSSDAGTMNVSSVCGGGLEARSLSTSRIPPRTGDHLMVSLGDLQDAEVPQHTSFAPNNLALGPGFVPSNASKGVQSLSAPSKTNNLSENSGSVRVGGRIAHAIAPRPSTMPYPTNLSRGVGAPCDQDLFTNLAGLPAQNMDLRASEAEDLHRNVSSTNVTKKNVSHGSKLQSTQEKLSDRPASQRMVISPRTARSSVNTKAVRLSPSRRPINSPTDQHCVLPSIDINTSSNTTATAVISDEVLMSERATDVTGITEAHISPNKHREVVAGLDLSSDLPFPFSDETPDISELFKSFGTSSHQSPPFSDMYDMNINITGISSADDIVTSAPETPVNRTPKRARRIERYATRGYKAKSVEKRKINVAEKAAAELEAEGRIPSNLPHRDGDHVTVWNKREQRKIAGNAAPLRRNLKKYFVEHPECEVYIDQKAEPRSSSENGRFRDGVVKIERHVSLWHKYEKRKIAGNAAPLEKNLKEYLKFHPEYEVYRLQDKIVGQSVRNDAQQLREKSFDVDTEPDKVGIEDDEEDRIAVESPAAINEDGCVKTKEDDPWAKIVNNVDPARDGSNEAKNSPEDLPSSTQDADIDMFLNTINFSTEFDDVNDADPIIAAFVNDIESGTDVEKT